jgi:hypothetical protein
MPHVRIRSSRRVSPASKRCVILTALLRRHAVLPRRPCASRTLPARQDTTRAAALFAERLAYYRELGDEVAIQLVQECLDG